MTSEPKKRKLPPISLPKDRRTDPIDWDTVDEKELSDRAMVFSYDVYECRRRLETSPKWVAVILAHLYIDHILTEYLTNNLAKPEAFLKKTRRKYVLDKLELCEAMGWIDKEISSIVVNINKIRNDLSHNLVLDLSDKSIENLKNLFPSVAKRILFDSMEDDNKKGEEPPFWKYLALLLVLLDQRRQEVLFRKYMNQRRNIGLGKAMLNARRVLEQLDQNSPTSKGDAVTP